MDKKEIENIQRRFENHQLKYVGGDMVEYEEWLDIETNKRYRVELILVREWDTIEVLEDEK
tara:strand:- start:373 stop:555 length:183 start_codon:yes stop_codon:yes gene_type:complete